MFGILISKLYKKYLIIIKSKKLKKQKPIQSGRLIVKSMKSIQNLILNQEVTQKKKIQKKRMKKKKKKRVKKRKKEMKKRKKVKKIKKKMNRKIL